MFRVRFLEDEKPSHAPIAGKREGAKRGNKERRWACGIKYARLMRNKNHMDRGDAPPAGDVHLENDRESRADVSELRSTHRKLRFRVPLEQVIVSEFATSSLAATTKEPNAEAS